MMFGKIKIDITDTLFSKLTRLGKTLCLRCEKERSLQCCHIFSRRYKSTRWIERNAIALCSFCHSWFDTHKMINLVFDPEKRVFNETEESFTFLVKKLGYTWKELQGLYSIAQDGKKQDKKLVRIYLESKLTKGVING